MESTLNKEKLFQLSVATLFGFSLVGILIIYFTGNVSVPEAIIGGEAWSTQLAVGLSFGILSGLVCLFFVRIPVFKQVRTFFGDLLSKLHLKVDDIIFYSFCAGVGEELFFRAALQPLIGKWATVLYAYLHTLFGQQIIVTPELVSSLGIWVTAVLFVSLHGYLNPKDLKLSFFGFLLVFVSAGLGLLYDKYGFFAAASAHFIYDVIMFAYVLYFEEKESV